MNKIIRKCVCLAFLTVFSISAFCQFTQRDLPPNLVTYDDAPYHFGFTLSACSWNFALTLEDYFDDYWYQNDKDGQYYVAALPDKKFYKVREIQTKFLHPGFAVGIVGNLRLGEYFDFRIVPGLSFGEHTLSYKIEKSNTADNPNNSFVDESEKKYSDKVECVFVDLPVLLKYKGKRIHNVRPYIIGGFEGKANLLSGVGYASHTSDRLSSLKLRVWDIMYTFGGGMDFYMFWFKLGVELRYGCSFIDTRDKLEGKHFCTNSIKSAKANQFQVIFTFE
ncbi:MAG: PorT family protein [Bacteroidales bacterium]|nr:PorT family protein [Bacteroidales bacterium]MBR5651057.1 PorT family protein [Bacteroidales bacterium]